VADYALTGAAMHRFRAWLALTNPRWLATIDEQPSAFMAADPAAMAQLLGDLWEKREPNWAAALAFPDVKLHLYGKSTPRPGRKMGHLTALASTAAEARTRVLQARAAYGITRSGQFPEVTASADVVAARASKVGATQGIPDDADTSVSYVQAGFGLSWEIDVS